MTLIKMTLYGFEDKNFTNSIGSFGLQVNPSALKLNKATSYTATGVPGQQDELKLDRPKPNTLNFDFMLDDTGVIPKVEDVSIKDRLNSLEETLYRIKGESHEPGYIKAVWGTFSFQGRLTSLSYDYSLFKPNGEPLRVKVSVTIEGNKKDVELHSPDLSRIIIVKAGDSLPLLCNEFYGDPSYCADVARVNHLSDFRHVEPGTRLLFPPLVRYADTTK